MHCIQIFSFGTFPGLKAVEATKSDDADKVMAQMKTTRVNDFYAKNGEIGPDGRHRHDMFLMQVKSQKESTEPWDYYNLVQTIPGVEAFTKLADSKCSFVKK